MNKLQQKINYKFKNIELLESALTHKSYANENNTSSYERLEFLGDAIIEYIVSECIIKYRELDSGDLSKLRASLVSTDYLYNISIELGLDKIVRKSKSLNVLSKKNTADLFESLIGAIYLDSGLKKVKELIKKLIIIDDKNISNHIKYSNDYKTLLQEYCQKQGLSFCYSKLESKGKDHDKTFKIKLMIDNKDIVIKEGKSIQSAEECCAKYFLDNLK